MEIKKLNKNFKRSDLNAPQGRILVPTIRRRTSNSWGFTLVELLVVISIIGLLSSTVLASLNSARVKARNASALQLIAQYKLAFELSYDADGVYPGQFGLPRICVGSGYSSGNCGFIPPLPPGWISSENVSLNNSLKRFMPSLPPRLITINTSSGPYTGIETSCNAIPPAATACNRGYRMFWVLESVNQNCGERAAGVNFGEATYCTFASS